MQAEQVHLRFAEIQMHQGDNTSSAVDAAKARLIEHLRETHPNLTPDQLQLGFIISMVWNDASLGCAEDGNYYAQVITPGYQIHFYVGNEHFVVHTNETGSITAIPKPQ